MEKAAARRLLGRLESGLLGHVGLHLVGGRYAEHEAAHEGGGGQRRVRRPVEIREAVLVVVDASDADERGDLRAEQRVEYLLEKHTSDVL